jgi:tetratricopeptide (TPR) repeat protein
MIFYIIPGIIIIISFLAIIFIIVKKFPNLAVINVESIAKEKELKVRNRIMIQRLARKAIGWQKVTMEILKPLFDKLMIYGQGLYQKAAELEKKNLNPQPLNQIDINQQVKDNLESAKKSMADQNFTPAEDLCVKVVQLDPKNFEVYEILAEIYWQTKEYRKARETTRYLLKLLNKLGSGVDKHALANCYADLGWIYQLEKKYQYALVNYRKAAELESSNPRFLDLLLKISIILKNKNLAIQTLNELRVADPDNQKLAEIEAEVDAMPDDAANN